MPTIKNLLPGEPEPLGPTVTPDGINFADPLRGRDADRAAAVRQHHRPAAEPGHPALPRDEPDGRRLAHLRRGAAEPDALQHPRRRPVRPGGGRHAVQRHQDAARPLRAGDHAATSTGSRATPSATTTPTRRPRSPPPPEQGRERRGGRRGASPTGATSTGRATATPTSRSRSRSSTR